MGMPASAPDVFVPKYAQCEHIWPAEPVSFGMEVAMPVLETVGPSAARHAAPLSAASGHAAFSQAALRKFGTLAAAVAGMERRGRARHRASLRAHQECRAVGRMAVLRALCARHQRGEETAQRRDPGAQLPDAGDLPLRRRFRRRLAAARARGHQGQSRRDRAGRRALHGRDREDPESRQDRADPRRARRLLARLLHHRRRRAAACASASPACRWSPTSTPRPR